MTQGNYKLVKTLLLLFLGVWLIFTLFPLYFMIVTSLKPVEEINRMIPTFWPETMKFNNYAGIFADPGSLKSLVDSVIVSVTNTALSLFLGTLAGYALARWVRGVVGENLAFWILSNRMFPPVAVIIPMFFLFDSMPWGTDSYFSLIVLYLVFNLPLATWLMMVFFRDAPRELEEAAYLDGYTPFRAFFRVTLPLVFPGMISVAMLCWIFAWNEYLFANLLTGTTVKTFPVHIPTFTLGSQTLWNLVMAFSLVAMLPPVILFIILRRYMVRGLSLGVVKG
ncbi:MAG TPA: carbohydrate ABC transporter permease [Dongiaceae bacterium]|jgi:multiple sugar transport system permease protein